VPYATTADLQRVLAKPAPTALESSAMDRVLNEGAREIDWDLGYDPTTNPAPPSGTPEFDILEEVNLARAVELWNMEFRPFLLIPAGPDQIPVMGARDSWYRHHIRLEPLRTAWGIG
jgi:hypothetical protein